jgi:fructose-1,6-bisphosphatase I
MGAVHGEGGSMDAKASKPITLDRFLVERQRMFPSATGELTRVITQVGLVAKIISNHMRRAALEGLRGLTGTVNVQNEQVKKLDEVGNSVFIEAFEYVDIVGALVSEEMEEPCILSPPGGDRGKYVVLVDPIDGSSNLDVDCVVGSIFSIRELRGTVEGSILLEGTKQVAAGYLMYGPSTILVYTAGDGPHSFVLDEGIGEFVLDHETIRMPAEGKIVSANFGNYVRWAKPARAFAASVMSGGLGAYSLRYSGALVADLHQILHRGGLYFYPDEEERPEGKLRLIYECAPLAMVAEQAGGSATTGRQRVMEIRPERVHQRIPFAIGGRREVEAYESHYARAAGAGKRIDRA